MKAMGANLRVVVAAAAVVGLGFAAPLSAEELVVGSFGGSFADNLKTCHVAAFEKATGATVSLKLGNSSQFAAALRAAAGNPDMDIVYIDNSLAAQAHNEGLTQTIDRAKLKSAPDILPSAWGKDDSYVVAMVSATTLVYNPKLVKTPPTSWLDLADPAYAGKYAIGDISGTAGLQFLLELNKLKGGTLEDITPGIDAIKPIAQGATGLTRKPTSFCRCSSARRSRLRRGIPIAPASPSTRASRLPSPIPRKAQSAFCPPSSFPRERRRPSWR
jgi:putative spermidine/putrescine transport system substrate-binding protein